MAKYELKTQKNDGDVQAFLSTIDNEQKFEDAQRLLQIMEEETGQKPVMWGKAIVGFGQYRYKYSSGQEHDWMATGFSPRKQNLTIYIMPGFSQYEDLMDKIGKHTTGMSCLYIKKLDDVDESVLRKLIKSSYDHITSKDWSADK